MEAISAQRKHTMHSFFAGLAGALGAWRRGAAGQGRKAPSCRTIGDAQATEDIYGRKGKADIYSSREMVQFYRAMSSSRDKSI